MTGTGAEAMEECCLLTDSLCPAGLASLCLPSDGTAHAFTGPSVSNEATMSHRHIAQSDGGSLFYLTRQTRESVVGVHRSVSPLSCYLSRDGTCPGLLY